MKIRQFIPLVLYLAVFAAGELLQRATYIQQENLCFFLLSKDFLTQTFRGPLPICTLIANFLVSFYRFSFVGAIVTAALVTTVFLLGRCIASRFTRHSTVTALLLATLAWVWLAHASTPRGIILLIFFELAILLATLILKHKEERFGKTSVAICCALIIAAVAIIGLSPKVQKAERWSALEQATILYKWDRVLKIANVSNATKDREMIPFAMLALNAKGQMADQMFRYPVRSFQDLDMENAYNRRAYLFSGILQGCMGGYLEAIHYTMQSGCYLPYGTGMVCLRQLLRYYSEMGDLRMVRKYVDVLKASPANRKLAKKVERIYLTQPSSATLSESDSLQSIPNEEISNEKLPNIDIPYLPVENNSAFLPVATSNSTFNIVYQGGNLLSGSMQVDRLNAYIRLKEKLGASKQ